MTYSLTARFLIAKTLDDDPRRVGDRIPTYALFVDPPLRRAGLTEANTRETEKRALGGERAMTQAARAVENETQGFMKIVVDTDTKQILGAAVPGPGDD